jgi:hypothetical protein
VPNTGACDPEIAEMKYFFAFCLCLFGNACIILPTQQESLNEYTIAFLVLVALIMRDLLLSTIDQISRMGFTNASVVLHLIILPIGVAGGV